MSKTVILIDHEVGKRDDRASARLAEWGYETRWVCPAKGDALPDPRTEAAGVIVYGGAESANDDTAKPYIRAEMDWIEAWLETGRPYLGLCLGGQMLARVLGAKVEAHPEGLFEIGYVPVEPSGQGNGFLHGVSHVYHWHKEGFEVPPCAAKLAAGQVFPNQAFVYNDNAYGLQFHPEVTVPVMERWISSAAYMLENPNAHKADRQRADASQYDAPLAAWLDRFLRHWLKSPA
jgi:GMP synthase (glutamine-hydrolysing)